MAKTPTPGRKQRLQAMFSAGSLETLAEQPTGMKLLEAESQDPRGFIPPEAVDYLRTLRDQKRQAGLQFASLSRRADLIIVPGFLGSELRDVADNGRGLIWVDPQLVVDPNQFQALRLNPFGEILPDHDATSGVRIESLRPIPIVYDLLRLDLQLRGHSVQMAPYDWRKDLDLAAGRLAGQIRGRLGQLPRSLAIVAHSQGALVARRALTLLGAETARRLVSQLILLGPANLGTFAAAFAIAGSHELLETLRELQIKLPADMPKVLQSFTGLYQLLPWKPGSVGPGFDPTQLSQSDFWNGQVDSKRLKSKFGWGQAIDTEFFNDRTAIILGDRPDTVGGVKFSGGKLVPDGTQTAGDGTIPDGCAQLPRVTTYRAAGVSHMGLPLSPTVIGAVNSILRGLTPSVNRIQFAAAMSSQVAAKRQARRGKASGSDLKLPVAIPLQPPDSPRRSQRLGQAPRIGAVEAKGLPAANQPDPPVRRSPPAPPSRKLRVFSFDPLLATDLETLGIADITIDVPWEADGRLGPGPVGEYVEVVDYDPASNRFYHPVYLSHPRLLAQDGLPPSESNPQFHQQMAYAVSMATIDTFEHALGRKALWAPRPFETDADGKFEQRPTEEDYVARLRIYPHALRDANAFFDPQRNALLFGYFSSCDQPGGRTMPGGTVFTCQSFDIIAHETTHALLHGLHRYYFNASNPDVFAFHEAFADVVALFQHFSHPEVVRHQIARTRGNLSQENLLGQLAQQFGEALGHRGSLRQYIGSKDTNGVWRASVPNPDLYRTVNEPHERGAILVAAIFKAFLNIYRNRSKDLFRIASGGTGVLPDGDIHPDLVNRLAIEASKSAEHILTMCVRALDYVPPVDLTFGEYLRALITADYELVCDDDKQYRAAVIDAFRQWGLYPADVNVLDETALRWRPPQLESDRDLQEIVGQLPFKQWNLRADRREVFLKMNENCRAFRTWLYKNARKSSDHGLALGVMVFNQQLQSVPRSFPQSAARGGKSPKSYKGRPRFEVHSLRPCCRVGPDGQQQFDLIAEVVQRRAGYFDPKVQSRIDNAKGPWAFNKHDQKQSGWKLAPEPDFWFQGGCTLIIDPATGELRYCVYKRINDDARLDQQRQFEQTGAMPSLAATYYGSKPQNPFAMLHAED